MRSARVESRVMRTIFGRVAAGVEIGRKTIRAVNKDACKIRRNMDSVYPRPRGRRAAPRARYHTVA